MIPTIAPDVYYPGTDLTGYATTAVAPFRFLTITADRTAGNITVGHAPAGTRSCGVSKSPAAAGELVGIARGSSRVVHVLASGALAAFDEVQAGADGQAVKKSTGIALGYAITSAAAGNPAAVSLYL